MNTLSRVDGAAAVARPVVGWRATVADYFDLGKPRIVLLLLITTAAAMIMAARGLPPLGLAFFTLLGGALSAASAGAFNCVYDRDIDKIMVRTQLRPLPAGRISVRNALVAATLAGVAGFAILYVLVNPLAAWLSLGGNVFYVVVYTIFLKRRTPQNIVIGGAAGAVPVLIGLAAVTGHVGWPAVWMFLIIFMWTPPHFWALSLVLKSDYARAGVPMLPVVRGEAVTRKQIVLYTVLLILTTLGLVAGHTLGIIYLVSALLLGSGLLYLALRLLATQKLKDARTLFWCSNYYLALLFALMVVDRMLQ